MKILVCRHVLQEGLGYLEKVFTRLGVEYEYQDLCEDPILRQLTDYQGLVIMGGPMNVDQVKEYPFLKSDYHYIETALGLGMPMLGFCLGAQLFAKVLGGKVIQNPQPELGWYDLEISVLNKNSIFNGFPNRCKVFQWHQDTFEIPKGAKLLASTLTCRNQAFSWGDHVIGLQFHLEVTSEMIQEWLLDKETVSNWGFQAEAVKADTHENIEQASKLGWLLGENFVQLMLPKLPTIH